MSPRRRTAQTGLPGVAPPAAAVSSQPAPAARASYVPPDIDRAGTGVILVTWPGSAPAQFHLIDEGTTPDGTIFRYEGRWWRLAP